MGYGAQNIHIIKFVKNIVGLGYFMAIINTNPINEFNRKT